MDRDLRPLLLDWPHDPDRLNARVLEIEEGRTVLQVRIELGILQMEIDGRPDGGEDVLSKAESMLAADARASIDSDLAAALRHEALQVHQRYVAMLALERYDDVVRDTQRNLRVFDLCHRHASVPEDRTVLEQFRPQVIATRARAAALAALRKEQIPGARRLLDEAVEEIRGSLPEGMAEPPECAMLEGMRDVLQPKLPVSQRHELERRIQAAIAAENYELAAILRDELRQLPG
jgi:murein L,D-transpeptidase YcbB/YkuD